MIGSIIKYSLVAFGGAVVFAVCMHAADDDALKNIKDALEGKEALLRAEGLADEALKAAMALFIESNRMGWDKTYTLAETGRQAQALYNAWI